MAQYIKKPMKKKADTWSDTWTNDEISDIIARTVYKPRKFLWGAIETNKSLKPAKPGPKAVARNGKILSQNQLDKITGADKLRAENKKLKGEVDFQTNRADDADADRIFADVTRGNKKPSGATGPSKPLIPDSAKEYLSKALESMKGFAKAHPVGTGLAGGALAALIINRIINGRKRRPKYAEAMTLQDRYSRGFATKCASAGVDPDKLVRKVYLRNKILTLSGVR